MQKYILVTLICSTSALSAMNSQENKTFVSLAPKCIAFCQRTIQQYKSNRLRASSELSAHFQNTIKQYSDLKIKIEKNQTPQALRTSISEFVSSSQGNILLVSCMWPEKPTEQEIALIKKIKENGK